MWHGVCLFVLVCWCGFVSVILTTCRGMANTTSIHHVAPLFLTPRFKPNTTPPPPSPVGHSSA